MRYLLQKSVMLTFVVSVFLILNSGCGSQDDDSSDGPRLTDPGPTGPGPDDDNQDDDESQSEDDSQNEDKESQDNDSFEDEEKKESEDEEEQQDNSSDAEEEQENSSNNFDAVKRDSSCIDGEYEETLPNDSASISSEKASYSSSQLTGFAKDVLEKRYQIGASIVKSALEVQSENCVKRFVRDTSTAEKVIGELSTVVHECGHMLDLEKSSYGSSYYEIRPDLTFTCNNGDTTNRGGKTIARSRIRNDEFSSKLPPCESRRGGSNCDSYANIYLDGDPDNETFEGGDQGFSSVLEETTQYVNSLATSYALRDQMESGLRTSARDGILTFLWYLERYLHLTRTEYNDAYEAIVTDSCWRKAILTVWGRAWLYLEETEGISSLGLHDDKLMELVTEDVLLKEIDRIRARQCN